MAESVKSSVKSTKGAIIQNTEQFCTFYLAGRLFGVDILTVKEISTEVEITPIYHAPEQVKGYVNIRGQIYLVIDLRLLLGYEQQEVSGSNKIVIFKNKIGEAFGVLVDSIGDVVEVSESDIEDMQKQDDTDYEFDSKIDEITEGVCRLEKTLLVIINPKHFLPEIRKLVDAYK